ncbi:unnamed protein product [Ixodes pacificus]
MVGPKFSSRTKNSNSSQFAKDGVVILLLLLTLKSICKNCKPPGFVNWSGIARAFGLANKSWWHKNIEL